MDYAQTLALHDLLGRHGCDVKQIRLAINSFRKGPAKAINRYENKGHTHLQQANGLKHWLPRVTVFKPSPISHKDDQGRDRIKPQGQDDE